MTPADRVNWSVVAVVVALGVGFLGGAMAASRPAWSHPCPGSIERWDVPTWLPCDDRVRVLPWHGPATPHRRGDAAPAVPEAR